MTDEPRRSRLQRHKIRAYRWMYEFTAQACSDCAATDCACKDTICGHVQTQASQNGVELEPTGHRLRFIGCQGCVVPPHLRETCTLYLCAAAQAKPEFRKRRYERLKNLCATIEEQLMRLP